MTLEEIADKAVQMARAEIDTYNVPEMVHLNISLDKGIWLAEQLGANVDIVKIGVAFMDLKLGQAFHEKRIPEHVQMSVEAADEYLSSTGITDEEKKNILACIQSHHGKIPFETLEAEICANADCYRFVHPKGILFYFTVLGRRLGDFSKCVDQVEAKMDEKMNIISLPTVKEELSPVYKNMKTYFRLSRE